MTLALEDLTPDRLHNYLWHLANGMHAPSTRRDERREEEWGRGLLHFGPWGPHPEDIQRGEWTLATRIPDLTARGLCAQPYWPDSLLERQPAWAMRGVPDDPRDELDEMEKRRLADLRRTVRRYERSGARYPKGKRMSRKRGKSTLHQVSRDGDIICCLDLKPVGEPVDLLSVDPDDRCPCSRQPWPLLLSPESSRASGRQRLSSIRARLVSEFGPYCVICKDAWARMVDHSHVTGLVRGYLCQHCNGSVDSCVHPSGDPFADYLNDPPALGLGMSYPYQEKTLRQARSQGRVERYTRMTEALGLPSLVGAYTPVEEKGAPVPEPTTDTQPPPETASESRDPVVRGVETKDAKRVTLYLHPDDYEFIRYDIAGGDLQSVLRSLIACAREDEALQDQVAQLSRTATRGGG